MGSMVRSWSACLGFFKSGGEDRSCRDRLAERRRRTPRRRGKRPARRFPNLWWRHHLTLVDSKGQDGVVGDFETGGIEGSSPKEKHPRIARIDANQNAQDKDAPKKIDDNANANSQNPPTDQYG
jgi:hypothetical protein